MNEDLFWFIVGLIVLAVCAHLFFFRREALKRYTGYVKLLFVLAILASIGDIIAFLVKYL